ncbi:MAG: hypothetical protein EDQ89_02560 [Acidobacteria bacterium]|nr:MAG: hypothetical protein EDQ89_02560 [Acidobacteriota bacterium]
MAVAALAAAALALMPAAAAAAPVLTIEGNCEDYPASSSVDMSIEGLPPFEPFTGTLETFDGDGTLISTLGPLSFTADENGSDFLNAPFGEPYTYRVTVVWAGGTLEATTTVQCAGPPGSPIADAGNDETVASGAAADLDGTGSSDPDGDPLTYGWTQIDGPPVTLDGAKTASPTFTAPAGPARLTFRLAVCDDGSPALCDDNSVTVKVMGPPPTEPPTLTLIKNCDGETPRIEVHLKGLAGYAPFTIAIDPFAPTPNALEADEEGSFDFGMSGIESATVVWAGGTLKARAPANCTFTSGMPSADAGRDQTVAPGAPVDLDGNGSSDPDGDPLTYEWTQIDGPPVTLSGAGTATPSFTAPPTATAVTFRLEVCDDGSPALCDTDTVGIEVASDVPDGNDYAARVIVNKPTWATSGDGHHRRGFVVKVRNLDKGPFTVNADDVAAEVLVNGDPTGTVDLVTTKVAKPGVRVKLRYRWRYGGVAAGDRVEYSGCVGSAGDPDGSNDCGSFATTAVPKP